MPDDSNVVQLIIELKGNIEHLITGVKGDITDVKGNLEHLITDVKDSLEREIGHLREEVHTGFTQVNTRLDTQAARLDRQGSNW